MTCDGCKRKDVIGSYTDILGGIFLCDICTIIAKKRLLKILLTNLLTSEE